MIIDRATAKEIESHFYNWQQERLEVAEQEREIAEGVNYAYSLAKASNSSVSNTVHQKYAEIQAELGYKKKWIEVVEATRRKFANTHYGYYITARYTEKMSIIKICDRMYADRRTLSRWRESIMYYAALKACELGLIAAN